MKLKERIAIVTGGGSGIGRAISLLFAEEGARVVVNDVRLEAAEATVTKMNAPVGGRAIQADVADSAQVRAMFATIERELGALDILVNNAGIAVGPGDDRQAIGRKAEARIMEAVSGQGVQTHFDITQHLSDEAWQRMLAMHLDGTFFCTREALRLMSPRNRGVIINLSSVAALAGLEASPHYSAAKGGILAFTHAVAKDVASRGIRVNAICPGYIDTPMTEPVSPLLREPSSRARRLGARATRARSRRPRSSSRPTTVRSSLDSGCRRTVASSSAEMPTPRAFSIRGTSIQMLEDAAGVGR